MDIELRDLERVGVDLVGVADPRHALVDQGNVGRGAAHVEGDAARNARHLADPDRPSGAADRAGKKRAGREFRRLGERHDAPVGAHDADRRGDPLAFQLGRERSEIVFDDRREIGVEHAGREPFELAFLAHHLRGLRNRNTIQRIGQEIGGLPLVSVIGVGVDEADRHRLASGFPDACGEPSEGVGIEPGEDAAVRRDPLPDLEPPIPGDQRLRPDELDVEQPADQPPRTADLDGVAEPLGGHQRGLRALAFQQRVGRDGGPVHEDVDRGGVDAEFAQRVQHAAPLAPGQGGHLGGEQLLGLRVEAQDVRERPAHIHPDAVSGR